MDVVWHIKVLWKERFRAKVIDVLEDFKQAEGAGLSNFELDKMLATYDLGNIKAQLPPKVKQVTYKRKRGGETSQSEEN